MRRQTFLDLASTLEQTLQVNTSSCTSNSKKSLQGGQQGIFTNCHFQGISGSIFSFFPIIQLELLHSGPRLFNGRDGYNKGDRLQLPSCTQNRSVDLYDAMATLEWSRQTLKLDLKKICLNTWPGYFHLTMLEIRSLWMLFKKRTKFDRSYIP